MMIGYMVFINTLRMNKVVGNSACEFPRYDVNISMLSRDCYIRSNYMNTSCKNHIKIEVCYARRVLAEMEIINGIMTRVELYTQSGSVLYSYNMLERDFDENDMRPIDKNGVYDYLLGSSNVATLFQADNMVIKLDNGFADRAIRIHCERIVSDNPMDSFSLKYDMNPERVLSDKHELEILVL